MQLAQVTSTLKVRRNSSCQGMYLDLRFLGGAGTGTGLGTGTGGVEGGVEASAAEGMMLGRKALCEDSTPK